MKISRTYGSWMEKLRDTYFEPKGDQYDGWPALHDGQDMVYYRPLLTYQIFARNNLDLWNEIHGAYFEPGRIVATVDGGAREVWDKEDIRVFKRQEVRF